MAETVRVPNRAVLARALNNEAEAIKAFEAVSRQGAVDMPAMGGDIDDLSARIDALEKWGHVRLAKYLNDDRTNGNEAITLALEECQRLQETGEYGRVVLDGDGLRVALTPGLEIASNGKNVIFLDANLYAGEGDWIETDPDDIAFFDRYQTVTQDAKVWSLRKPVLTILGGSVGFQMIRPYITGENAQGLRVAAGVRVKNGSAISRRLMMGRIDSCEGYGLFVGADVANNADIDLFDMRIVANGNSTREERTSYGAVLAGNDMHWLRVTFAYAHCPLLVGQYGSTKFVVDPDFFNGAGFDPGPLYPHRLIEYHGNSCTFNGGRWGNGQPHIFNTDIQISFPKYGVTNGWLSRPDTYFVLHAGKVNDDCENFGLKTGEIPIALRDGTMKLFECREEGGNTWRAGIKDTMERADGYTEIMAGKVTEIGQGTGVAVKAFHSTTLNGAMIETRAPDTDFDMKAGFGNIGNEVQIRRGEDPILTVTETDVLAPFGDRVFDLGRLANEWDQVFARRTVLDDITLRRDPTLELPQAGSMAIRCDADGLLELVDSSGSVFNYRSEQYLASYYNSEYPLVTSGSTYLIGNRQTHTFIRNAATVATLTIELPYLPEGDVDYVVTCTHAITALTVQLNTSEIDSGTGLPYSDGHSIAYAPTTLAAGGRAAWRFRAFSKIWYPA